MVDLGAMQQITPNLVFPDSMFTWSNIVFSPTAYPEYCYVGTVESGQLALNGYVERFGPVLNYVSPCDGAGMKLTGRTSRTNIRVVRPANNGRALALGGAGKGHGPTVRYTVTLANGNKKNKTTAAAAFEPAGLVVILPTGTTYVKATVRPRPMVPGLGKHNKTLAAAVYDVVANTVTWPDVALAGGKKRKYTVVTRVNPATVTNPLTFAAACPNCPALATASDVTVRWTPGGGCERGCVVRDG